MIFSYIVVCRDDRKYDGSKGDYTLATRNVFATMEAANEYAKYISDSREPIVVPGRFNDLNFTSFK